MKSKESKRSFSALTVVLAVCTTSAASAGVMLGAPSPPPTGLPNQISQSHPTVEGETTGVYFPSDSGWLIAESVPHAYHLKLFRSGLKEVRRFSPMADVKPDDFGTVLTNISPDAVRGARVRFSALLRPHDLESGAGMWVRADGADGKAVAFDAMQSRPVIGTQDWKRYEIVLDVPRESASVAVGVLLIGKGRLDIDELKLEKVGNNIATTSNDSPFARAARFLLDRRELDHPGTALNAIGVDSQRPNQ